jgi:hypothetical protein
MKCMQHTRHTSHVGYLSARKWKGHWKNYVQRIECYGLHLEVIWAVTESFHLSRGIEQWRALVRLAKNFNLQISKKCPMLWGAESRQFLKKESILWNEKLKTKLRGLYRPSYRALFGEVSANFCGQSLLRGRRDESLRLYSRISRPEPLLFLPSSSSVVLTRLSEPRSRATTS